MTTKGQICNFVEGLKPAMLMVVVQVAFAGVNVFYKLATNAGVSLRVIIAYRFTFSSAFMIPLALFFERGKRPKMTWTVLFQAFLCALFGGTLAQSLYLESLTLTSATFACAVTNLIPAITFILAVSFRLESLAFGTLAGKAKVLGTLMGIGGAMLLTFFKGFRIDFLSTNVDLLASGRHLASSHMFTGTAARNRVLAALMALGCCFSNALWLIIQAKMSEKYPCHYTSTALMSSMGLIQAVTFAVCVERDWSQWKLGWNIRLWTVAYSGIVGSGLMVTLMAWCVRMRGPLFVSDFKPLLLLLVALAADAYNISIWFKKFSVLGAILIVCGLYVVLWGKGKEMKKMTQLVPSGTLEHEEVEIVVASPPDAKIKGKDIVSTKDQLKEQK